MVAGAHDSTGTLRVPPAGFDLTRHDMRSQPLKLPLCVTFYGLRRHQQVPCRDIDTHSVHSALHLRSQNGSAPSLPDQHTLFCWAESPARPKVSIPIWSKPTKSNARNGCKQPKRVLISTWPKFPMQNLIKRWSKMLGSSQNGKPDTPMLNALPDVEPNLQVFPLSGSRHC